MKKHFLLAFFLILAGGCSHRSPVPAELRALEPQLSELLPGSAAFDYTRPGRITVRDGSGKPVGEARYTWPFEAGARGFAGPVPVMAVLDASDRVVTVLMLPSRETPEFLERLRRACFGDSWSGFSRSEASGLEIDAVSRATYSSNAVIRSTRNLLQEKD